MSQVAALDTLNWIRDHVVENGGVVVSSRILKPYPEVTGYLIPTLLARGEEDLAFSLGKWLVSIQQPNGSFLDPDATASFAFDTGQVLRGLLALAPVSTEASDAALRAARWLMAVSTLNGRFPVPDGHAWDMGKRGRIPEGVHLYILPALAKAAEFFADRRIKSFVSRSLDYYLKSETLSDFSRPNMLSHLYCYMQEALVDLGASDVAERGMKSLACFQQPSGAVPAYSDVNWICTPGLFQASIVWRKLGDTRRADAALSFGETLMSGSGGFFGSIGVGAEYFHLEEISWAAKFYLDAGFCEVPPQPPAREIVSPPAAETRSSVPATPLVSSPVAGETRSNMNAETWHDHIVDGASPADISHRVTAGKVPRWIEPLLSETKSGDYVLELGSGTGELSAHLARAGRRVSLLDFSRKSLDFAAQVFQSSGQIGSFVEGDVTRSLPFDDASFDVVWSSGLLEHFDDSVITEILREAARCARHKVVSLVPNAGSIPYRLGKFAQEAAGTWAWGKEDPKTSLRSHCVQAGLVNVREHTLAPEHAIEFLRGLGDGSLEKTFREFFKSLPADELAAMGQGYLLVTVAEVLPRTVPPPARRRSITESAPKKISDGRRRLAVVPFDPVQAYVDAGYPDLTEYFNPQGFFDEVYCLSPHEPVEREIYGMKVLPTPVAKFADQVRALGIDVVRAYDVASGRIACARKVAGVPVIVSVHNVDMDTSAPLPDADLFVSISGAVTTRLQSLGVPPALITPFANRVDLDVFRPRNDPRVKAEFDRRFPGKHRVLFVGRRTRQKNLETLIRSLGILGKDYVGIFVGKGDVQPYRLLAKAHGVLERCHFIDTVSNQELPHWYSYAECMCTPSRYEGFGIVFIEALACGAAVVTSDVAPMNEFITDGLSGLLVKDYENPDRLAEAIERACTDRKVRDFIRANARFAAEPFSKTSIDRLEVNIYRKTLGLASSEVSSAPAVRSDSPLRVIPLAMDLKKEWESVIENSPDAWFFHSYSEQVLLEQAWNGQTLSFLVEKNNVPVAAFPIQRWRWDPSVIHSTLMGTGGPAVLATLNDQERQEVLEFCHGAVQEIVRMGQAREIRIALPPLSPSSRDAESRGEFPLASFGYTDTSTHTQVIDLTRDLDAIFHGFSKGHRSAIHKAEKQGLEIREVASPADMDDYYALHVETYRRTGERPHPRAYFDAIWRHFASTGKARIAIARKNGQPVGATNTALFGDGSLYWTGAYSHEGLALEAGKLLQWDAIRWAKSKGALRHETGEVFPDAEPGSKLEGLSIYKRGFGGETRRFFRGRFSI